MEDLQSRLASALGDRYAIEHELGRGGMALVYRALDHKHGRRVAIKVLDPELAGAIGPDRFLKEIAIASRLTHPNILPLHDSGAADGLLYYVMPYVEGESLRDRLARERHLSLDDTVAIVASVAAALSLAHRQGVVHRDIKPENILLSGGQAIVADFGIAHAVDAAGTERLTATGLAIGTPAYMSPEQAGAERALDGRSDVYSLGCVAYELLAGEPPFSGATPQAVMARHVVDPVPPLRTLRPTVPAGVQRVIERALAKVPADRFATADAFAAALTAASSPTAVAAERDRHRHGRRTWMAAVAVAAVTIGVALWRIFGGAGVPAIRRFAVLPFEDLTADSTQQYLVDGVHEAVISDLADDGLGVIARTSVLQYRHSQKPVREIARELGVDALVETSMTRTDDSVSLETHLVDGHSEQYLWSHAYGAARGAVPTLARHVARGIAAAVDPAHAAAVPGTGRAAPTVDPEVYDDYLKGMAHLHLQTKADLKLSREYFERAIAKDSTYAPAWAGISEVWSVGRQDGYFTSAEATAPAEAAAYKALALDSTLAEPHHALAEEKVYGDWDWAGGEREFQRAIALRPDFAEARAFYAHLLCILHRPNEAVQQMERARALDPLDPLLGWINSGTLILLGRYDDAIAGFRATLERAPDNPPALWLLWLTLHNAGRHTEAYPVIRHWAAVTHDSAMADALDAGHRRAGYTGAIQAGADLQAERTLGAGAGAWNVALWYAAAGEKGKALDWLERAYQEHDPTMPYLGTHPSFRALHGEPRFRALMRKMQLPAAN